MSIKAERISERLPHFYMHWDRRATISSIVGAVGKNMDEAEKDFVSIMQAHWVDTAPGEDLDRIGRLYSIQRKATETDDDYRGRLKTAVLSFKGGGTRNAILMMVRIAMGLPPDYPVAIEENPAVRLKKTWKLMAGTEWTVNPRNIRDAEPEITIAVETEGARISDPVIRNLDTGESIMYRGELSRGDVLRLAGAKATLNGKDVSSKIEGSVPVLPRKKTKWQYTESVGANLGAFDSAMFDRSVFSVSITSAITMEWTANQPATFDVIVEKSLLDKSGVSEAYLQEIVNMAKGCGVKAGIRLAEPATKGGI
ncbi:hypothetical protein [Methanocella sp. MCL-LM]|uniref:hypothetical protein n=1 Tax=Methanocella sp. MCL-LM TaxID=3412035 RepID=UPI003C71FB94